MSITDRDYWPIKIADCSHQFFSELQPLVDRQAFSRYLEPVRKKEWIVYAKAPFAGPEQVLDYVGRYTHRVAISNNRLLDIEDGQVSFRWKDYRDSDAQKTMIVTASEFIRRFLLHVLPLGLQRIRYYGFLGNRYRKEKIERCRRLLQMKAETPAQLGPANTTDYRDRHEALTGVSLRECPVCHRGHMVTVEQINPVKQTSPRLPLDTS